MDSVCPTCLGGKCPAIDSTPSYQSPRDADSLEKAILAVASVLEDVDSRKSGGRFEAPADLLAAAVKQRGHSRAAAYWAIHTLHTEGKISAHLRPQHSPSIFDENGKLLAGGGLGWVGLPTAGPVPFNAFLVRVEVPLRYWGEKPVAKLQGDGGKDTEIKTLTVEEVALLANVKLPRVRNVLSEGRQAGIEFPTDNAPIPFGILQPFAATKWPDFPTTFSEAKQIIATRQSV